MMLLALARKRGYLTALNDGIIAFRSMQRGSSRYPFALVVQIERSAKHQNGNSGWSLMDSSLGLCLVTRSCL